MGRGRALLLSTLNTQHFEQGRPRDGCVERCVQTACVPEHTKSKTGHLTRHEIHTPNSRQGPVSKCPRYTPGGGGGTRAAQEAKWFKADQASCIL